MTRRIALAILLCAWAALLVGGVAAYVTARQTLIAELDNGIIAQGAALPHLLGVRGDGAEAPAPPLPPGDRYLIRNEIGQTVARPSNSAAPATAQSPLVLNRAFVEVGNGTRMRSLTLRLPRQPTAQNRDGAMTVVYTRSAEPVDRLLGRLALTLLGVCGVGGALTLAVALRVSRAATQPLRQTAEAIGGIDESNLHRRIDTAALPAELAPVAERLNQMLQRLDSVFAQRKQFLADAAHELRTPIAALRMTLEVALRRPREPAQLQEALEGCLADARHLSALADALLEQVRAERFALQEPAELVDACQIVRECVATAQGLGTARSVRIQPRIPGELKARIQPQRLRSIVTNLLSNAVEYSPPGGVVELQLTTDGTRAVLSVADRGPGIAPEHLPHLFEPFYRADSARSVESGHLGLGLFLVQSHAKAMGGECRVHSASGKGTEFSVVFPVSIQEEEQQEKRSSSSHGLSVSC